jgi:hypothetical protein
MSALDARVKPVHDGFIRPYNAKPRPHAGSRQQPTFCQTFPNLACFCPSFSKHFFGGFVGFQGVTRFPNLNVRFPNFLPFSMRRNSRRTPRPPRQRSAGIVEGDMEAPYHRFRFTERKIADARQDRGCPLQQTSIENHKLWKYRTRPNLRFQSLPSCSSVSPIEHWRACHRNTAVIPG